MKFLKTFEAHEDGMSREEMCDMLCKCGYEMSELENCSNQELAEMCRTANEESSEMANESSESWTREEMCNYLCKCGYTMNELEECPNHELAEMCRNAEEIENTQETNEAKDEKWIKDVIKRPGALRKKMKKEEGEKITKSEIQEEIAKLKEKDKDPSKKGIQGLNKKDLTKLRQLNLAKTLKGLKEHQETENYMFFANVQNVCNFCQEILAMDKNEVDKVLSDGHGWATDHIATSKDDVEEVVNFLRTHTTKSEKPVGQKIHSMDPDFVKRFTDFPGAHNL